MAYSPWLAILLVLIGLLTPLLGHEHEESIFDTSSGELYVVADLSSLRAVGANLLHQDQALGLGFASLSASERSQLSRLSHAAGRCAGYEGFPELQRSTQFQVHHLEQIRSYVDAHVFIPLKIQSLMQFRGGEPVVIEYRDWIREAVEQVDSHNLQETVEFLSSYNHRTEGRKDENVAILEFKGRLASMLGDYATVDEVEHREISQRSLRVRIKGKDRPSEIVILGAHIDSISQAKTAPGADDNASGTANLNEILRILKGLGRDHSRTIEVYFYAGEERGLLGSHEIAGDYKGEGADVIGVLQLDMTLYPGSGHMTFATITDYTNSSLREFLAQINRHYVSAEMIETECGYGCSDHASWYRNGFATVFPFESSFYSHNRRIHTARDVVGDHLSFEHSAVFTRLALAFALELANSDWRGVNGSN